MIRAASRKQATVAALAAAVVVAATDAAYYARLFPVRPTDSRFAFFVTYWAVTSAMLLAATAAIALDRPLAYPPLIAGAAASIASGIVAILSIGWVLVAAGLLALVAGGPRPVNRLGVIAAALPIAILVIGLAVT